MLVSPGLEITVSDESQYVSTAVGTVPFVLLATAQDKIFNGLVAPYTTKEFAGKLVAVTSQRDLITNFGYPDFKQSASGTPSHGNELNEYGLMAAYSALGVVNRMFIIRADIDLDQLAGTSIRPIGNPTDGTHWLDLTSSAWGVYEWNAVTQTFVNKAPLIITSTTNVTNIAGILTPNSSVGRIGSYAIVANSPNNYLFYKRLDNNWVQVGSTDWQNSFPAVQGTVSSPTITPGSQMTINAVTVSFIGSSTALAVSSINSANIPGVTAGTSNNKVVLFVTNDAKSDGVTADGLLKIVDGPGSPAFAMGIQTTFTNFSGVVEQYITTSPALEFGGYVQIPDWRITDDTPRPSGSVWVKTSVLGAGANLSFKVFNEADDVWTPIAAPIFSDEAEAIYQLDRFNGGFSIEAGSLYVLRDVLNNGTVTYRPYFRETQGSMSIFGNVPNSPMVFVTGDAFRIKSSLTGQSSLLDNVITLSGPSSDDFVSALLAANIPDISATIEATGAITLHHRQGGVVELQNVVGTPLTTAGFTSATVGLRYKPGTNILIGSNFAPLVYTYSFSQPYTAPEDGTMWYYNSPLDVDIMINDTTGWKGYKNVSRDARGFNLTQTDPAGPIMAPIAPITQADTTPLVAGDLWINTGDLENYPLISRWTGHKWQLLDNTDIITQNGIVFADARWDTSGTVDPAAGRVSEIADMLTSNYKDLDCPDHRLYPRGTLLFNTRRSGFNIKRYMSNYFNEHSYPDQAMIDPVTGHDNLPVQRATWVTSSGLQNDGSPYMGHNSQRIMVVKAMRGALDANDIVREESFQFNLIVAPGYQELISNMVMLNNDRKNTAFIIGDTPMDMPAKIMDFTAWSNNTTGKGLSTADPYLGVYYPHALTNDLQGNTIMMPASHMILRAAIKSDQVSYPWFAYAGTRRGTIDNATDIGYVDRRRGSFVRNGVNQGLRDALYQLNINPLTILPGVGLVNFGNKTRNGFASSMDRVNVARLINYIRTILAHVGDGFLFEPNDAITRNQIRQVISGAINDLIAKRGIYDYLVICDETNNTNDRIARNELYVDIAIEPMKAVEFIYIPIRLKNPGGIKASGK